MPEEDFRKIFGKKKFATPEDTESFLVMVIPQKPRNPKKQQRMPPKSIIESPQ